MDFFKQAGLSLGISLLALANYAQHTAPNLQEHGHEVSFRNIKIKKL